MMKNYNSFVRNGKKSLRNLFRHGIMIVLVALIPISIG